MKNEVTKIETTHDEMDMLKKADSKISIYTNNEEELFKDLNNKTSIYESPLTGIKKLFNIRNVFVSVYDLKEKAGETYNVYYEDDNCKDLKFYSKRKFLITNYKVSFMIRDIIEYINSSPELCKCDKIIQICLNNDLVLSTNSIDNSITDRITKYLTTNENNVCLCVHSYASTDEFPEDKYYLEGSDSNKIKIPLEEVLSHQKGLLTKMGFIDVNEYIGCYNFGKAYIHTLGAGKRIIEEINKFNKCDLLNQDKE